MKTKILVAIFVVLFLLAITLVSCEGPTEEPVTRTPLSNGLSLAYYNGMPCIIYSGHEEGGISCDWTQWKGEGDQ